MFCLYYFAKCLPSRKVNWLKTDQLKTDVWRISLLLALMKVSDIHSSWESRFPGRPLGDFYSVHFFPTVYEADSKLMESLRILQLSPLCLRSSPPSLKIKPFLAGTGYFIRTLGSLMNQESGFIDSYSMIWQPCDSSNAPRGFSEGPAAPATFPELVTSAVTGRQLGAFCSVYPYHFFCLHPSLFLVR